MAERVTPHDFLTVEEYLKLEESATVRHEYVGGEVFAMVGATKRHNRIVVNISSRLWVAARGGNCRVYSESVKLRVSDDVIYYPGVMVACGPESEDPLVEDAPCLVVEVVSVDADHDNGGRGLPRHVPGGADGAGRSTLTTRVRVAREEAASVLDRAGVSLLL